MRHLTKPGKTAVQYSTLYSVISSCMDCLRWYEHWFAVDRIQHCVQVHCRLWEHVHGLFTSVWLWVLICSWSHAVLHSSTLPALGTCPWTVYECMTMSVDLQLISCSAAFKYIAGFENMSMDCLRVYDYECWFAVEPMQRCIQVHCWLWRHVHGLFTTVWVLICSWSHAAQCSSTLPALRTCPDPTAFWPWCIWQKCLAQS